MNFAAVDAAVNHIHEVKVPGRVTSTVKMRPPVRRRRPSLSGTCWARWSPDMAITFRSARFPSMERIRRRRRSGRGEHALDVPVWETDLCIQCGSASWCVPRRASSKVYDEGDLRVRRPRSSPRTRVERAPNKKYTLQLSIDDCTVVCALASRCVRRRTKAGGPESHQYGPGTAASCERAQELGVLQDLPDAIRGVESGNGGLKFNKPKDVQLLTPYFEFSSARARVGETPYLRLMSQLFGDRRSSETHGLLEHLRRKPTDDAVDG